jgi:parallel beta-helix repeat protein
MGLFNYVIGKSKKQNAFKCRNRSGKRLHSRFRVSSVPLFLEHLETRTLPSAMVPGFNANTLGPNDDGSSGPVALPFAINYFGTRFDQLWVNNNGNVTFDGPKYTYTPFGLTGNIGTPIIAPFFADVDTRGAGSGIVTYGTGTVDGHQAFGVNYAGVGYYYQHTDKLNSFQVLIVDRGDLGSGPLGDDFDIEFNYDQIQWETGDASGGSHGLGGTSAVAGFSKGTGDPNTYYQIPGSLVNGAFLDSNLSTGLIHGANSPVPGRYVSQARDGAIIVPPGNNHTENTALDLGVAPGIHLQNRGSSQALGDDWYKLQLLRPDSFDVSLNFDSMQGNLACTLRDSSGIPITPDSTTSSSGSETLHFGGIQDLPAGTYYLSVSTLTGTNNAYDLSVDPGASSLTRVWYVNDSSRGGDLYALAAGNDANSGLDPTAPLATLQALLSPSNGPFNAHDLIHVDTGNYGGSTASIGASSGGVIFAGSPVGTNLSFGIDLAGASNNTVTGFHFLGSGTGISAHGSGPVPSNNNLITGNYFGTSLSTAIQLSGGTGNVVSGNTITNKGPYGIYADVGDDVTIENNTLAGPQTAIDIASGSSSVNSVLIDHNTLSAGLTGIYVGAPLPAATIQITTNTLQDFSSYGIDVLSTGNVSGNTVSASGTGIYSGSVSSVISDNALYFNSVGLEGYGRFGGSNWDNDPGNDIHNNTIGVIVGDGNSVGGGSPIIVQFNRIYANATGIDVPRPADINHNLIYRNTTTGVLISGALGSALTNNTIYSNQANADGVRIQGNATNISLENNILWVSSGYDLYVATNSQQGFSSDYNNFYKTGSGVLIWWQKAFNDLYDWQSEAASDLHSIGYTAFHTPTRDDPLFANSGADNYHLSPGSTSIDAGDPASAFNLEPGLNGNRINLGAYGNTSQAEASPSAFIAIDYPNNYSGWLPDCNFTILWHSFGLTGNVKLELYDYYSQTKVADITTSTSVANGAFTWQGGAPSTVNPTNDPTSRYYIKITSLDQSSVATVSREPFALFTVAHDYYVSVNGNNRNTGTTPNDPKASILPILTAYRQQLGPTDTIHVSAGGYDVVRNILISADVSGHGQGFSIVGDSYQTTILNRDNPYAGSTDVEITSAGFITMENLSLVGGERGLWLKAGSTHFTGQNLEFSGNTQEGLRIKQDSPTRLSVILSLTIMEAMGSTSPLPSRDFAIAHPSTTPALGSISSTQALSLFRTTRCTETTSASRSVIFCPVDRP